MTRMAMRLIPSRIRLERSSGDAVMKEQGSFTVPRLVKRLAAMLGLEVWRRASSCVNICTASCMSLPHVQHCAGH
jgi:hypothetical protein